MRLAVEITTCTPQRAGIGYYTEHLVDGLLATCAPGDEVVLIGNRKLGPDVTEKWAGRLRIGGAPVRYLWMQTDAPAHAARCRRRLRRLPELPGAAGRALPLPQHRPRPGADPHAGVLQHAQAPARARVAADRVAVGGGGRHRVGGLAPRRGLDAVGARAPRGHAAGRAAPELPPVDRRGDRARPPPVQPEPARTCCRSGRWSRARTCRCCCRRSTASSSARGPPAPSWTW